MSYDLSDKHPDYFDGGNDCLARQDYKCDECLEEAKKSKNLSIVRVVTDRENIGFTDKEKAKENFTNQIEFVQTALEYTDTGMDRVKVSELPQLVEEAKKKITVGKMKKLMDMDGRNKKGVIKPLITFLATNNKKPSLNLVLGALIVLVVGVLVFRAFS